MIAAFVYYFRGDPYIIPDAYYYLLSILSGVVFTQILILEKELNNYMKIVIFFEILLIPLSFITTQQALFKTVLSRDPWVHWVFAEEIMRRGHIPPYSDIPIKYTRMPNFHLLLSSGLIILDVSYKWVQVFVAGISTLILLLIVAYIHSLKLFGDRGPAFIAVLLVAIADNVLDMTGRTIIPNSLGVALAFLIVYLVYSSRISNNKIKFIAVLLTVSLVLTHTVSYTFLIWQVFVITMVSLIFRERNWKDFSLFLGYLVVLAFFEWAVYSGFYLRGLLAISKQLFIYGVSIDRYESHLSVMSLSFRDALLARLGMFIYFTLAGTGLLLKTFILLLKEKFQDRITLSNVLSTGAIVAGTVSFLFPALSDLSHRFWYYGEVLSSAFVASLLCQMKNARKLKTFVLVSLIFFIISLSFLMFKANIANDNNPLVPYYSQRTGWQDSELETGRFLISKEGKLEFASDWDYSANLAYLKTNLKSSGVLESINRKTPETFDEVKNCDCIFIFRKDMLGNRLFYLGGRWTQTPHLPLHEKTSFIIWQLITEGEGRIYDNGNVLMALVGDK
nr:hypothetical protein [Thermococcus alcaliphilus]